MKNFLFILLIAPFFSFAQGSKTVNDGFIINGSVTGFADGTTVSFLNEQTGTLDKQATIEKGKFIIKGKLAQPGYKGLVFGQEQPLIPLFIENSNIRIAGDKNALDKLLITGSPTHDIFSEYTNHLKKYEKVFSPDADYDPIAIKHVVTLSEELVTKHPTSFVSPLAILRLIQASEDAVKAEKLFDLLSKEVKASPIAVYTAHIIAESKVNPIGSVIPEFSQADTSGNTISISAFRGKYVLVDFWASWCGPCRRENPNVVAAFNKYKSKNFTVVGVSLDQAKPAWMSAIKIDGLSWTQLSDLKGWGNSVAAQFQVKGIPQNFLLDPEGRIIAKNLHGPVLDKKLEALIK
ncbi:MAG: TlpA disulfide reductase family protein [Chitinophagaceae bacterium]